jgi:bacillithiol biosynthesis cysteine-adding enzyme BshC
MPGTSALFADYLRRFPALARFYRHDPHSSESLRAAAAEARIPGERRARVVAALRARNSGDAALRQLDRLAQPGAVAIVTGQQVGLFGGPSYTLYKALTAIQLARQLSAQGVAAVPVFWLATEDHDLAEADHCWIFGPAHQPVKLGAKLRGPAGQPVGRFEIESTSIVLLRETLAGFAGADAVAAMVERAYAPGRTMGQAFQALLEQVFEAAGLIFLDPLDPALREIGAPLLVEALARMSELSALLEQRDEALHAAGYHTQVLFEAQSSLLMLLERGRRVALRRQGTEFLHDLRRYTTEELAAAPVALSPNALLRPVWQDFLLPTAAYVGGPAEIAYFAQSTVLYDALLGRAPVFVPRAGFTLLDERARKLMTRFDLTLQDCLTPAAALRERISAQLIPAGVQRRFAEAASTLDASLAPLREELYALDPTLAAALDKSTLKIRYQLDKNRGKAARAALRRETQAEVGARHLTGLLYPERHLQERLYSFLPFLAEHGLDMVKTLEDRAYNGRFDHQMLTL